MMSLELGAVELFGLAGLVVTVIGNAMPTDQNLRFLNLAGCALWIAHFSLMSAWGAVASLGLAMLMISAGMLGMVSLAIILVAVNGVMVVAASILLAGGIIEYTDFLPLIGGFLINAGVVMMSGGRMTAMIASGEIAWMSASIAIGSLEAFLGNTSSLVALSLRTWSRRYG